MNDNLLIILNDYLERLQDDKRVLNEALSYMDTHEDISEINRLEKITLDAIAEIQKRQEPILEAIDEINKREEKTLKAVEEIRERQ